MLGILGMRLTADNSNTKKTFNWVPIPFEKSVIQAANAIKKNSKLLNLVLIYIHHIKDFFVFNCKIL
jgi:hypothetical protein